tara:strand:- start:314 stop:718 length:405 start_codon:yes stop_codon:yes gene_type:complete
MTHKHLLFIFFITIISCERETCYSCKSYELATYNQDLNDYEEEFEMCEFDGIWDRVNWIDDEAIQGATLSFIDFDEYTIGFRAIENNDLDGDGIDNWEDDDFDGDSIPNNNDIINDLLANQTIQELIVCSENGK